MGNLPKNRYLSIDKAAKKLGVSTKTLRRWEAAGKLVAVRTKGGHRRYLLSELNELSGNRGGVSKQYFKTQPVTIKPEPIPYSLPETQIKAIDLYETLTLHPSQKNALKNFFIIGFSSLLIFGVINTSGNLQNGYKSIKENVLALVPAPNLIKPIITSYERSYGDISNLAQVNENKNVLAAEDSTDTPLFNINIRSRFNQLANFVNGLTALSVNTGTLTATDSATFESTIAVTGNATFANDLDVSGDITSTSPTFNLLDTNVTTLNIGGVSTTTSISAATGTTTINNNLIASGNITGSGTLSISGASTLSGDITAGGDLDVDSDLTVGGTLDIDGNSTFGNITSINGVTYSFPSSQGAASSFLSNDGSGNLTWSTSGSSITGSGTANSIAKFATATTLGDSLLTDNGTTLSYNSVFNVASGVTTGNGVSATSSTLSTGNLLKLTSTSTSLNGAKLFNVDSSGSNSNSSVTNYGIYSTITNTGSSSTNVAGYFSASGATNNYGLVVPAGFVGVGTSTPTSQFDISAVATGGSIFNLTYNNATVLSGDLTGAAVNLDTTNLTANNTNVTAINAKLPTVTNNGAGSYTLNGILSNFGTGGGINTTGSGSTTYNAGSFSIPALTQTSGTLTANGLLITTPSGITTGGTANGINLSTTGVGAGTLRGINIGSITGGAGTEDAINIGSGWDSILKVNSTTVINGSGVTQVAGGGTGQSSYTTGDILYASNSSTLTKLGVGSDGYVLTVSSGVPIWNTVSGSSCTNCLVNNPSANQTLTPTGDSTGLSVRQTATGSPTADIFSVTNNGGGTKYFYVDADGVVNIPSIGSTSSDQLTIEPGTDKFALKLLGTNVSTTSLQLIDSFNTSGNIFDIDYIASTVLAGTLTGLDVNVSTNVTATNQSVYGANFVLPTATNTHTSGTRNLTGLQITTGGGLNQNGAGGTTQFAGVDITIPALTQSAGTIAGYGVNITTPSSITTGGTASALNIAASGVGAGTLNGIAISTITGGAGTETALSIGSGWDTAISLVGGGTIGATTTGLNLQADGSVDVNIAGGSSTTGCTITNSTGDLTCTGNITGATSGTAGFWNRTSITLSPSNANDLISLTNAATGQSTSNLKLFNSASSGTFTTAGGSLTNYAGFFNNTSTESAGSNTLTNIGLYASASGADANYAAIFESGNVGLGDTTPDYLLELHSATTTPEFALSDDDISHSITDIAQADVFGTLTSISTTGGGLRVNGISDSDAQALSLRGIIGVNDPTDTVAAVRVVGAKYDSGTNITELADSETIFQVANSTATKWTVLGNGYLGLLTTVPETLVHLNTAAADTNGQLIRFENSDVAVANSQGYGKIEFEGNDNSGTSDGIRGYIYGLADVTNGTTGSFALAFATATTGDAAGTEKMRLNQNGFLGIGTTVPGRALDVNSATGANLRLTYDDADGSASNTTDFSLASDGDLTIDSSGNNINFGTSDLVTIPGVAGSNSLSITAGDLLMSDGSITLTDADNAATFALTNNTATTVGVGVNTDGIVDISSSSLTTGNLLNLETTTALTTGRVLNVSSTSTALTTGNLGRFDWSPGSAREATGDLFNINIGANGTTTGNLFTISDTGSALFAVSETQITSAIPHQFTAPGDISVAYDLQFTNPVSSFIKSDAPLYVISGETFNSSDLTLRSYNLGNILLDTGTSSVGTGKVGIGPGVSPISLLHVSNRNETLTIGKALAIFDQGETQDILTASASGTTKFSVASTGILTLTNGETIDNNTTNGTIALNANTGTLTLDVNGEIRANLNNAGSSTEAICGTSSSEDATDSTIDDCTTSVNADYAEFYATEQSVEYGDIVIIGPDSIASEHKAVDESGNVISIGNYNTSKLIKANGSYQNAIGIVSNNWSDFSSTGKASVPESEHPLPIALNGRVPVKMALTSDTIKAGDYVATSDEEGKAMKATQAGYVVGRALENWDPLSGKETVMIFVTNMWYTPTGNLSNVLNSATGSAQFSESMHELNVTKLTVLDDAILGDTVINGKLNVGGITIDNIEQSINAIGVLKIQDMALGNVEFMNGLITFETDGSAKFESITASKYKVAGTSAGNAVIKAGQVSTIINTTQVKTNSLIFVTAQTTTGRTLAVTQKTDSTSFKVELSGTDSKDINFNWWIVDKE